MNRCRLCLQHPGGDVTIREKLFNEKLGKVFQIEFTSRENFPEKACDKCVAKVHEFYSYQEQVHRSQQQLIEEQLQQVYVHHIKLEDDVKSESVDESDALSLDPKSGTSSHGVKAEPLEEHPERPPIELIELPALNDTDGQDDTDSGDQEVGNDDGLSDSSVSVKGGKPDSTNRTRTVSKKPSDKRIEEDKRINQFFSMVCEICSDELPTFYHLQIHFRKAHSSRGFVRCCNQKFYRKFKVLDHISFHLTPDAYRCELCQKNYRSRYTLQQHNDRRHSEPRERPFKCDKCHQAYEKKHQLKSHISRHVKSPCHLCGKVMSSAQALRVHVDHIHGKDEKLVCDTCGATFRTKPALVRHIQRHLGQEVVVKRQCPQCGIWVSGVRGLKNHIRNVHPDKNEVFECEICHQRCKNATTLYQHRKGVHAEDQYACDFCDKKFKRKIYLKEHRASHTGQSLYSCDVCGLKTNSNANMYSHKKNKHPLEWREAQLRKQLAAAATAESSLAHQMAVKKE